MKNSNLLNRLLSYSHEKQSPQRLRRYAVMLLMLLTLGVGQMWAAVTIYYVDKDNWGTVKCHHWKDGGSSTTWPGSSMSDAGHQKDGHTIYSITFNDNHDKCIFNNGSGTQTGNISISNGKVYYNGSWYTYNSSFWDPEFKEGQYIYINYSTSTWGSASAKFRYNWKYNTSTYCCNDNESGRVTGENYAYAVTPNSYVRAVQILRFNSTYGTQWNYTNTVAVSSQTKNCINLTASVSNDYTFTWGTYAPPLSAVSLSDNGTAILAGGGTELNPYLIATGATIKVRASGTKAVDDPDAAIWYDIKDNTTSLQNSTTATHSFKASATANTVYQMKVEGYTKVSSTSSSKKTSSTIYYKTVSVKDISVYVYVGGCTSDQINSIELFGTPYVGSVALDAVHYYIGDFTTDGNWRKYTFTNVSEVQSLVVARSGGRAVDNITATADVYAKWDGTALDGKCVSAPSLTWTTAPADGTAGGNMTAVVNTTAVSGGSPSIIWTTSDDAVAEVDEDGVITYVAAGTATITASVSWSATGDYCAGSQDLEQAITVSAAIVPTISAASFTNNPILTWEWVKISFTYANIPDGAYYRIKGGAGYYRDKNNLTNIPISGDGTENFEAACDQVNMIDNQSWVVEIYNSSNAKIVERTVGNLRVTSQAAELSSITLSPNTTQNYAGSPIDITMSVTSKYVPNPVVIFYVADNSNSTTYEVVATTGAIGSRTNYTTTHTATFSASHAATYSVTAKVFAGLLLANWDGKDFSGGGGWFNNNGGHAKVANPAIQANNASATVQSFTKGTNWWDVPLYWLTTTDAHKTGYNYRYIHTRQYSAQSGKPELKVSNYKGNLTTGDSFSANQWCKLTYDNYKDGSERVDFFMPLFENGNTTVYIDDIILSTEASMTARATQSTAASVTVRDVYTITYKDQGDVAFSGSHVDSPSSHPTTHTYGTATTLNSATKTGYTFGGWFDNSACTGVTVTSLGATAYSDDITLYAKWTEVMSDLSTSCHYDAGTPGYAAPTVSGSATNVGYVTTRTITATAAGTGYTFAGWTLTNCTRTDGGSPTATSITIRSNGDGADVSVVANYNEVLTQSTWIVAGGNKIVTTGTTWRTTADANNSMVKKTGHAAESVVYFTVPISTVCSGENNGNYQFKIYNTSTSTWYGLFASGSYYLLKAEDGTEKSLVKNNQNIELRAYVTGDYVLKLDYSTSTPKLTVTWPVFNQVRISAASPSDAGNVGNYDLSDPVSNVRSVKRTLKANTTYTFKIMYNSDWYGFNSGTFTRSNSTSSNSRTISTSGGNMTLTTDYAGDYTFKFNQSTKALSIDFPEAYKVTYGKGAVNGSASDCSAVDLDNSSTAVTSNSTWVKSGHSVKLTAPTEAGGYTFDGWYDNDAGTGTEITTAKNCTITVTSAATYYACYHEHKTAITINTDGHGTITTPSPNNSPYSLGVATTQAINATASEGYHWNTWTYSGTAALGSTATTASNTAKGNGTEGGTGTVTATFSPNTYRVQFHRNGGAGDVVYQDFTYDAAQNLTANTYTRTGYNFAGWALTTDGAVTYTDGAEVSNLTDTQGATYHLYAKWQAKTTNITLDQTGAATTGSVTTRTGTYNADMPAISGANTLPVAPQGYAFMGYYDALEPLGNKYYNADGTSARTWNKEDAEATLYAYFKQAEITELVASPGVIAPGETITITPTIVPTPTGTTKVCYEVQYINGTPLPSQPTFTPGVGNAVSFPVPSASATYIIQATLAKGSSCPADPGDVLSTRTTTFQVAGEHTVTIRYQDSDGRTLKASTEVTARPLDWTEDAIEAPTITGYTFHHWAAGDGVTLSKNCSTAHAFDTAQVASVCIKATYDGTLTAVYNKKNMIYFNNTLGWSDVYVYFYSSDAYWVDDVIVGQGCGTGSKQSYDVGGSKAYYRGYHGHMTQIEGTNIWYYDYEAEHGAKDGGEIKGYDDVVFVETEQNDYYFFYENKACRRGDFKHSLSMFVPINTVSVTKNKTDYYNKGYWMNYPENTGYVLHVYAGTGYGTSDQLQEIPFEFTEDKTLPMSVNVELNASRTYGFEIHRADGTKLGENEYTLVSGNSGDEGQTVRKLGTSERSIITTTVAGDYTFKLNYGKVSSEYYYLIGVHYPVVVGDYRILYTDDATWSKGAHSPEYVWSHDSRTIHKENGAKDIVSFYVKYDSDTKMKFQKINSITANTGAVSWADVPSGNIDLSSITEDGVYNFYLSQANGVIRVDSIRPYTGKYYIRTDCAGATKWENFRTSDHEMTYSEYTETNHGYSHYYPHWVEATKNVKFCIANDYSPSITDTLVADYGTVIANIDAGGYLQNYGANIRFMWNQSTNKIWRAYIGGSGDITDRFLVLEGDAKLYDENGDPLTNATGNRDHITYNPGTPQEVTKYLDQDNQVILHDDENFVYERTIKVQTGARAKLTAKYNGNVQYFRGSEGAFAEGTTVELLGGDAAGKHTMRIVYDFKTNRLVTAYVPSGTIEDDIAINADLMIVREHQEAGQQLLFNDGSLSEVHTVYGVMRFNRWTLNNKETTGSHDPVGDPKSAYERALYWISFPFNVNLSDVFGFGTYGTHWIIMEYDGAARAKEGYWADSKGFWKYVTNRTNKVLEAGKGYVLALDLDLMKYNDATFWTNNIEQVELFFPSAAYVENIESTNVTTTVEEHECKIDRTGNNGSDINKNRTKADSHWNMIGIPSYANYGTTLKDGEEGSTITWNINPYTNDLPFLYEWNMVDNTYTVQSGTTYPFKSMHAYMVQYHGNLYWSLASATPVSPIVARRTYAEKPQNVELRLELSQNEMKVDQTFVKLSNDENASTKFAFDEDLCKEYNANKANIYTFIEGYIPAGGNTLPMTEQTMVVPVGVKIAANGDYTFAIPEGTEGIGITLIDNETGIRTSLSALDYTINLPAGTYNDRFVLEISPVHQSPTGIELLNGENGENGVRKVLIDNILYIVKDGVMYDARGSRVQ